MRFSTACALAALTLAAPATAQTAADPVVKAVDDAGRATATKGAPGTVMPDTADVAKAPGIQAPFETPVTPTPPPVAPAPTAK